MMLWIILTLMTALAAVGVAIPLLRRPAPRVSERDAVLGVLKEQLAEIEAQVEVGAISASEANTLSNEVRRRLLAEAREADVPSGPLTPRTRHGLAGGAAALIALGATGLYAMLGRPDLVAQPADAQPATADAGEITGLTRQVEARVAQDPTDPEGWRILGLVYFQAGRFTESANAYRRAVALAPDAPGPRSAFGEALVQAAQGTVTPEAADAFEAAKQLDPTDSRARYFLGVLKAQRGDRRGALDDWVALLKEAPADAPWVPGLRQLVERAAREEGGDIAKRLPPVTGPTAEQVAAAGAPAAPDRQAMIRTMVDGLAARLAASPRDADGWVRLMRARMVLGEPDAASDALRRGLAAFAGSAADQRRLRDAAKSLGVPNA